MLATWLRSSARNIDRSSFLDQLPLSLMQASLTSYVRGHAEKGSLDCGLVHVCEGAQMDSGHGNECSLLGLRYLNKYTYNFIIRLVVVLSSYVFRGVV